MIFSQLYTRIKHLIQSNDISSQERIAYGPADIAAMLCFFLLAVLIHRVYINWNFDDSYIVYRIVDNILNGHGWVYNPGENYNASTSVLNTIAVTAVAFFLGNIPVSAHLVGSASIFFCMLVIFDLVRGSHGALLGTAAGILIAAVLATNKTWGLESHLFAALTLAFVWMEKHRLNSWYLLGFIFLARPDGILFFGMKLCVEYFRTRELPVKGPLQSLIVVLPWLVFSLLTFGQLLPETLENKVWQGQSGYWGTGAVYFAGFKTHLKEFNYLLLPLAVLSTFGAGVLAYTRSPLCYLIAFALAQQLFYLLMNVPAYHWYFTMLDLSMYISCIYAVATVLNIKRLVAVDIAVLAAVAYLSLGPMISLYQTGFEDSRDHSYRILSEKIDELDIGAGSIAALEVGTLGFLQNRKIVDLVSLTSNNPEFLSGSSIDEFFVLAPKIVVVHDPAWPHELTLLTDPRFKAIYREKSSVVAPVPTKIFVRSVDGQQLTQTLKDVESSLIPSFRDFAGYSSSQRCFLDTANGQGVLEHSRLQWPGDIDALVLAGWAFDTVENEQPPISIAMIDDSSRMVYFDAATIDRPDIVAAFGKESYVNSGFHVGLRRRFLEAGIYQLAIYHPATDRVCDLLATVEIVN